VNAPIVRGTARRLGLRRPPNPHPTPPQKQQWPDAFFGHAALAGAITTGMVSAAQASKSAAEYFAALRKLGGEP
jgi:hypothetical protein